ncbi:Fis family transcriptional regulator [Lacinutrix sp. Bg11-31]|nr:Fis family transcriptional regulator [Lacinutrix sp. Bg11-31]
MSEGLFAINLDSEIISANPSFCEMTGFSEKELIGIRRPYPFSPPELKKENNERYNLLMQNKNKKDYENTYMHKNGNRFPVHVLVSSIYDENGVKTANFATIQDITERKKAEIDLKLAKEFNDKLIESMQEGMLMLDMSGRIIKVNDSLCEILGYSEKELIGLELPYPFAKAEDLSEMQGIETKVSKGEAPSFQFEFTRKNGEQFMASFLAGNIKDDNGEVIAIFATVKDISEEEKAKRILENNAAKSKEKKDVILELANLVGENINITFNKITHLAAKTLDVERVSIWSFNKDKSELYCEKLYLLKNKKYEIGGVLKQIENPKYFQALESKQAVLVSNAEKDSITKRLAKEYLIPNNIKSLMDVVINSANGHYGIVCFEHVGDDLRDWSVEDQAFSTSIASIVSLMVESTERKVAENKTSIANQKLTEANKELNVLRNQLEQENMYLRNELDLVFNYEEMVYGSIEFSNVLSEVEKVAPTTATVLLLGESGTGKELLARAVHNTSLRNKKPLIKVNCSAIPRELIESELFGHKKGSFTGAINDKIGKFELADGGTLFLDEIGELPLDMQPKILRFLQEGEIEVVGGTTGLKKLDVRVIAATNRDLKAEVEKKQFREDLYFRLNVFPIEVPPLRKRKDDIPLLVEHFVDKFNKAYGKSIKYIPDDAMSKLKAYNWPGNIRELENLIERASIVSTSDTLLIPGFESSTQKSKSISKKDLSLDSVQRNHIIQILEQCNWKISGPKGAAIILNLKPSTLRDRITKLEITKA